MNKFCILQIILTLAVGLCYAARLENTYLPPAGAAGAGGGGAGLGTPSFGGRPGGHGGGGFGKKTKK